MRAANVKSSSKTEILTLRDDLDSNDSDVRKRAAKRCVALMRAGESVGSLFPSMMRCVKTTDLELKRLTYLYLANYASEQPEEAIMAVNAFITDSENENPVVRSLAVRTMSRIRVPAIAELMVEAVKRRLDDREAYVRKTAALSIAQLYDTVPETVWGSGAVEILKKMITDSNPLVVANATSALIEIGNKRDEMIFEIGNHIDAILSAISSSTEWCQIVLLDALSRFEPRDADEAGQLIDRLMPLLKHSNPALVLGAFKCIFVFSEFSTRDSKEIFSSTLPPILSLVSGADPEIQFVVLRTLSLFVIKHPKALAKEIRIFFCKYNDPSYIKVEKLDIVLALCTENNAPLVVSELQEYCNSVDVAFVRKSVRCLGQVAIKIPAAAPKCVDVLVQLVKGHADYAVEESIIVFTDLLRCYPGRFESVIETICNSSDQVKNPQAKAALLWILGEYCGLIDKIDLVLDPFLDSFSDDPPEVQMQTLTAMVKVYVTRKEETKDMLQFVLNEATKESILPDIRNRALIYWRLLSADQEAAKEVIVFDKKPIKGQDAKYTEEILDELIRNMGTTSGVLRVATKEFLNKWSKSDEYEMSERDWTQLYSENGLIVSADFDDKKIYFNFENTSETVFSNFAIALNKNSYGFTLVSLPAMPEKIEPGASFETNAEYFIDNKSAVVGGSDKLQFALRINSGVAYFSHIPDTRRMGVSGYKMKKKEFLEFFGSKKEYSMVLPLAKIASKEELTKRKVCVVAEKEDEEYCFAQMFCGGLKCIADIIISETQMKIIIKADDAILPLVQKAAPYTFCDY